MQIIKKTRLAAYMAMAMGLAACGAGGDGDGSTGSGGGGGGGGGGGTGGGTTLILDATQDQLSGALTGLCHTISSNTPAGSPIDIGGFICALDPTLNNLLDSPDSLLTGLLTGLQGFLANPSPATLQAALTEIQKAITGDGNYVGLQEAVTGLAQDLPCALLTLAKQDCGAGSPTDQLTSLLALFSGGSNPFAGTPLEPLGALGGAGTPVGGPTGTPLDALLTPLTSVLGGAPLNGQLVDQLGQGLSLLGTSLVNGYGSIPGAQDVPLAGDVVLTLGNLFSGLGTTLDQLETGTGGDVGDVLNSTLIDVANLLTGPTGLLGSLAEASGQAQLVNAVSGGNAQLVGGITQLTNTLSTTLLLPLDNTVLNPLLGSLAPLTCALQLFGACSDAALATDPTTALTGLLGILSGGGTTTDPLTSLVTDITSTLSGGTSGDLTTLLTDNPLATVVDSIIPGGLGGLLGGLGGLGGGLGGI